MAETTYANYQNFGIYARDIASHGAQVYNDIKSAYDSIRGLNNSSGWRGEKYDKLVDGFNSMVIEFNNIIEDIQYKIPKALRSIASQFASFDTNSFNEATTEADKINNIEKSNTKALTWTASAVESAKTSVNNKFEDAKNNISAIKSIVQNMNSDWSGDSYDDLYNKISSYERTISSNIETLNTEFKNLMDKAQIEFNETNSSVKATLQVD